MPPGRVAVWALVTGFWVLFGIACSLQLWVSMLAHNHSVLRLVAYEIVVWSAWILVGYGVAWMVRRFPLVPLSAPHALLHLAASIVVAVVHIAWWVASELLIIPFDVMNPTAFTPRYLKIVLYQAPVEMLLYFLAAMTVIAYDAYFRDRERELRAAHLERRLAEARLQALELQIRPHFLFNTLNAVSALVHTGARDQALGMIGGLSDLLRYALDRAGTQTAAAEDEVAMARRYLEIQRLRAPDRLSFSIDLAPEARRAAVPVLLLQPLVENAVRHGIEARGGGGSVDVRVFRDGGRLRIRIWNTGRLDERRDDGIGLANTRARLEQLYAGEQSFSLRAEAEGVVAEVDLPWAEASVAKSPA